MSLPFQYQFMAFNIFVNSNDVHHSVKEFKPVFEDSQHKKYNFDAKPYYKRNNKNISNSNYVKGINPNMNAAGSRSFNGCSNRSYKK